MKILDRLRNRSPRGDAGDPGAVEASSAHEQLLPIAGYDRFDGKQLIPRLSHLSQVELATVDAHERSHRGRPARIRRARLRRDHRCARRRRRSNRQGRALIRAPPQRSPRSASRSSTRHSFGTGKCWRRSRPRRQGRARPSRASVPIRPRHPADEGRKSSQRCRARRRGPGRARAAT